MEQLFSINLNAGIFGSVIILIILALRPFLRNAPRRILCALWLLAAVRLLMPFELESDISLQPRYTSPVTVVEEMTEQTPEPVPVVPVTPAPEQPPVVQVQPEDTPVVPEQPVPADPAPTEKEAVDVMGILSAAWAVGILVVLTYGAVSYCVLKRRVRDAAPCGQGIRESERINSAFLLGYLKPEIYLPVGLSSRDREFVIAHELTHKKRGDNWWKLLGLICVAIHWYNPLVWLGYILVCRDIETACDEQVIGSMDLEERKAYSYALLNSGKRLSGFLVCPVAFGEVNLKQRIKKVLSYRQPGFWITAAALALVVFVGCCFLTSPMEEPPPTEPTVTDPTEPTVTDPTEPAVTEPTEPTVTDPTEPPTTEPPEEITVIDQGENSGTDYPYTPISWKLTSDGTLTISGNGALPAEMVPLWKAYSDRITTVIVADGITRLPYQAFSSMKKVSRVYLSNTLESIGESAFYDCIALRSVTIPASVGTIAPYAFGRCTSLCEVSFAPDSRVAQIGQYAFTHSGITAFSAPASLRTIGLGAFSYCPSLQTVVLDGGVETVQNDAFSSCSSLKHVVLGGSVKTMVSPFSGCTALAEVTFTESLTTIPAFAFFGCSGLTSVTIPDTVSGIGDQAFSETGLQRLVIPDTVKELGNAIVSDAPIREVVFEGDCPIMQENPLCFINATVYYPADNETWITDELPDYGGQLTWVPYTNIEEV